MVSVSRTKIAMHPCLINSVQTLRSDIPHPSQFGFIFLCTSISHNFCTHNTSFWSNWMRLLSLTYAVCLHGTSLPPSSREVHPRGESVLLNSYLSSSPQNSNTALNATSFTNVFESSFSTSLAYKLPPPKPQ